MRRALAVGLLLVAAAARADLFSPGELSKPHAGLSGLSQCTRCHPAGGQLSQGTCLACHDELQPRLGQGRGLHGRVPEEKRNCESCHHEHQGEDGKLVDYGPGGEAGFNHQRAGWPLKGKHDGAKCSACHEPRRILWPKAKKLLEQRPHTKLGLGSACADCHFDEHRGQLHQDDCASCHDEKGWAPAPGFNHNDTEYPLRGKHRGVKCASCHVAETDGQAHGFPKPASATFLRFAPLQHQACLDCHKDPHGGRFGARCESCHVVEGWGVLRNLTKEREFHEKTRFKLTGAHLDVECRACHGPFPGQRAKFKGLAFATCAACHADAHLGQLGAKGQAPDCGACHADVSFAPAKYDLAEHAKSRYPLEGAHAAVPCPRCHLDSPALQAKVPKALQRELKRKKRPERFSFVSFEWTRPLDACGSCHADVHRNQFAGKKCEGCHQVASFAKVTFDHQRDARFALEGAHAKAACEKCHRAPAAGEPVKYRPLEQSCRGCHLDVHAGQFSSPGAPAKCESCHGLDAWKTLRFVHEPPFTDFRLDGKHAAAKCEACHRAVTVAPAVTAAQYRGVPRTCEGCHADFHRGAFRGFEP